MGTVVRPDLPGTYTDLEGALTVRPAPAVSAVVALPIEHDWGPDKEAKFYASFGEFEDDFGDGDTDGRDAVLRAFVGSGLEDEAAAGGVIVYRMGVTADLDKATLSINNTTPAAAITFTAVYAGTRGHRVKIVKEDDPVASGTHDRIRVLFDDVTVETFRYAQTDIAALAADVTANSRYVDATSIITGVALTNTAAGGVALAGGGDGGTLTATEWGEALDALEYEPFTILTAHNLTTQAIQNTVASWVLTQDNAERPIRAILGGPDAEAFGDAQTRVDALRAAEPDAAPHLIVLAGGTFHDDFTDKDVSTAQLAPRIAGMLAGRGERGSLTLGEVAGLTIVGDPTISTDELVLARDAGLTTFRRTSSQDADLVITQGVTAYIEDTDGRPYSLYSDPRIVGVIDLFRRRMKAWGDKHLAGKTTVTEEAIVAVNDRGSAEIRDLLRRGLVLPGVAEDERPFFRAYISASVPDAVVYEFGWLFAPTVNYLIGKGRVR